MTPRPRARATAPPVARAASPAGPRSIAVGRGAASGFGCSTAAGLALVLATVIWSYWPTLVDLWHFWKHNDDYSAGRLVPLLAAFLVWRRRKELNWRPSWAGLAVLAAAQAGRLASVYYGFASGERLSLGLTLSGLVLLAGGLEAFRRLFWVQAFFLLTLPWPQRVHDWISPPLQDLATALGVFGLEVLGFWVQRAGNVVVLDETTRVLVAEACSGLRMLTAFIIIAAVWCFLLHRPPWQKALLLALSVPTAVICNGARVLVTSIVAHRAGSSFTQGAFHDLAGLAMVPVGLLLLMGGLKLLDWLMAAGAGPNAGALESKRVRV